MSKEYDTSVYAMDSNDQEAYRLREQHDIFKAAQGGHLVRVPIDLSKGGLRILDSATADGYWLYDLAHDLSTKYPSAAPNTYVGTDITTKRFPSPPAPDITLSLQSITEPWPAEWANSFDVVHQRLALAGCRTFPIRDAVLALLGNVKPGGWVQLIEPDQEAGPNDGPWMKRMAEMVWAVLRATDMRESYAPKLQGILRDAGWEEVHEEKVDLLLGATNPDPELGAKGVRSTAIAMTFFVDLVKTLPPQMETGLTEEDLGGLVEGLRKELIERGGTYPCRLVWARKPLK